MFLKYWRYTVYLAKHKWFVFLACCAAGIPLAGIVHDWSKFLPDEFLSYAEYFYGGHPRELKPVHVQHAFDVAWLKHQHRNPHHYQHWILVNDSGETTLLEMPRRYVLEMCADWQGAGRVFGKTDTLGWYLKNREKMRMNGKTRLLVESRLGVPVVPTFFEGDFGGQVIAQ